MVIQGNRMLHLRYLKLLRAFDATSLRPGRYRLRIAPVSASGAAGRVATLYFWVLAPAKATHKR